MKIKYKPAEELVILEMVEYSLQKIAETVALIQNSGHAIILNWADGIVFHHSPLPFNTKELLKERMKGRIYWASVMFAGMPDYVEKLKVGALDIPVVATPNPVLRKAAAWLRGQLGSDL